MPSAQIDPSSATLKSLSREQVAAYERDGFCFPIRVMPASEANEYRRMLESFEQSHRPVMKTALRNKPHLVFTWINELIRDSRILDVVEDILGPNILAWGTNFFIKEPGDRAYISWHQDATYWGLSHPDVTTAWIALSDVTPENGAMRMMPGSHLEQLPHVDTFAENNLLTRGQEVKVDVDESKTVDVPLKAGEMSLHHVRIVHGSGTNNASDRRIALAIRYVPTYVSQISGARDFATLVRGKDTYHHFELEPAPTVDVGAEEMATHKRIAEESFKILYRGTGRAAPNTGPVD